MTRNNARRFIRPLLLATSAIGAFLPVHADAQQASNPLAVGSCSTDNTDPKVCQYVVPSVMQAPYPAAPLSNPPGLNSTTAQLSEGVRLDGVSAANPAGTQAVLFDYYYSSIGPRFVSNLSSSDIFVPQNSAAEFSAFINSGLVQNGSSGVTVNYAIPPNLYTATPRATSCGLTGVTPAYITNLSVPAIGRATTLPYVVDYYTEAYAVPGSTSVTIGSTGSSSSIQFSYPLQSACSTDNENNKQCAAPSAYDEDQAVVLWAIADNMSNGQQNPAIPYVWGNPTVSYLLYPVVNGAPGAPIKGCPNPVIAGACSPAAANGQPMTWQQVSGNPCKSGDATGITASSTVVVDGVSVPAGWNWTCQDVQAASALPGSGSSCSAIAEIDGACGSAANATFATAPTTNLCSAGIPTVPIGNLTATADNWNWTCQNIVGGNITTGGASCSAVNSTTIPGACGSASGGTYAAAPTANLCSSGLPTAVTAVAANWQWVCNNEQYNTAVANTGPTCTATNSSYSPPGGPSDNPPDSPGTTCEIGRGGMTVCTTPPAPGTCGNGGICGCIGAGTPVLMADGSYKAIETICAGDEVRGASGRANRVLELKTCPLEGRSLYAFNGGAPLATGNHPFVVEGGFASVDPVLTVRTIPYFEIEVGSLSRIEPGATLLSPFGRHRIHSIEAIRLPADTIVYDLVLDGDQTYYAGGFAVRSQHDNAHGVRVEHFLQQTAAGAARYAAVGAFLVASGLALTPEAFAGSNGGVGAGP